MADTQTIDGAWDARFQFGNRLPQMESREDYERACAMLEIEPLSDEALTAKHGTYEYAEYRATEWTSMGRDARVCWIVNAARWRTMKDQLKAAAKPAVVAHIARPAFGAHGRRYDESCDRCGRTTDVDNDSGLCSRCHQ
jgi:hypothetical protein